MFDVASSAAYINFIPRGIAKIRFSDPREDSIPMIRRLELTLLYQVIHFWW